MPNNKAIAFLFNNCEKLLLRTSHSHAQLRKRLIKCTKDNRSNRQVCHIYSVDVSSLFLSVNRVEVYLSVFALFSYCNLVLCRQKETAKTSPLQCSCWWFVCWSGRQCLPWFIQVRCSNACSRVCIVRITGLLFLDILTSPLLPISL